MKTFYNLQNKFSIKNLEKRFISKSDRFKLSTYDKKTLKKQYLNASVLILGATGSIGKEFSLNFLKFDFKKLILLDKNENELADLNREILRIVKKKKILKIEYICSDITNINLNEIINKNNITDLINFSAMKHVRSEENLVSSKYLFKTNILNNFQLSSKKLKRLFSVSTDKASNPSSFLGVSKLMMEYWLCNQKKNNNKISISSARFANVSFSNGSILKYALESISKGSTFGIPLDIKRYFITHDEAVSLCLHSLLPRNNGFIIIPSLNVLKKDVLIKDLIQKMLTFFQVKYIFVKKFIKNKNKTFLQIILTTGTIKGQKKREVFSDDNEDVILGNKFPVDKIKLKNNNYEELYKKILNSKSLIEIEKNILRNIKSYKPTKSLIEIKNYL